MLKAISLQLTNTECTFKSFTDSITPSIFAFQHIGTINED